MDIPKATILRLPAVKARTGLGSTSIYRLIALGTFPKPVRLGLRAVGWVASEIDAWIAQRVEASRQPVA
jgi:prophage regulatory protein